ncbi:hypothetical protein A5747_13345 [Mycobacterium sp. IS-836]|uniref:Ig-like domain-containing protein n=1 Tax=Mycobacterium sp. IS-836 TaxID=1834160 RepID=UPI00096E81A8|nr:Ig-like domain-containing protein [Mycobacterium sp. IS-836]OMC55372.1 hypothetical protein A5747_13345 [Mycobacterium sp. IS-836]
MTSRDFVTIKDVFADLTIAAINCAVLLAPYSVDPVLTLESATDGGLDVPAEYVSVGHFEKKAGVTLTNKIDSTDIEAYGEPEPIRTIISKRTTSFDFAMYQNQRNVLELFWAADFSGVVPSDFGGVVLEAPPVPKNVYYRAIILGLDDRNDREIWPYWLLPKVKLSDIDNQQLNDDGVIEYHPTLKAFKDGTTGYSVAQGFAGPGWRDLVHKTGFVAPVTAISATPSTATLTAATGASHTQQLLVEGDNGVNYTPDCTFTSADPTKATVSAGGLITGVAAGSAVITAHYTPLGGTELTDTVTATVS